MANGIDARGLAAVLAQILAAGQQAPGAIPGAAPAGRTPGINPAANLPGINIPSAPSGGGQATGRRRRRPAYNTIVDYYRLSEKAGSDTERTILGAGALLANFLAARNEMPADSPFNQAIDSIFGSIGEAIGVPGLRNIGQPGSGFGGGETVEDASTVTGVPRAAPTAANVLTQPINPGLLSAGGAGGNLLRRLLG